MWDHPFQWGSKRTGPDLARVGAKWPAAWHWDHMRDPRSTSGQSIMPGYPWLFDAVAEADWAAPKMHVLKKLGVPYTEEQIANARTEYDAQAAQVVAQLAAAGKTDAVPDREITALIAYLLRLGKNQEPAAASTAVIEGGR
jgi:cytochrome c oxidase cbb3-type subunit I/II